VLLRREFDRVVIIGRAMRPWQFLLFFFVPFVPESLCRGSFAERVLGRIPGGSLREESSTQSIPYTALLHDPRTAEHSIFAPNGFCQSILRKVEEGRFHRDNLFAREESPNVSPQMHFDETDFHFGVSGVGQTIQHEYHFTNSGQKDLTVSVAGSSCGCTTALLVDGGEKNEITVPPKGSTSVRVTFQVQSAGAVQQTVTLKTNDPYRPIVYLTLRGTVPWDLRVSPASLTFVVDKGAVAEKVVTILGPPTMDVTQTTCDNTAVKVTLTPEKGDEVKGKIEPAAGKSWKLQVAVGEKAPVGEWKATVTINTTHPERPTITIPVTASIRGDLEVSPKSAFFGFLKVGDKATRTIRLTSRSGSMFKVTKVLAPDPKVVDMAIGGRPKEGIYDFTLTVNTSEKRFVDAKVTISTDVPGEETLTVPITALVE